MGSRSEIVKQLVTFIAITTLFTAGVFVWMFLGARDSGPAVNIGAAFVRTVLVCESGSLWPGVVLHLTQDILLMGMFFDMTVKAGCAGYLVSETSVFLGSVYLLVSIAFWRLRSRHEEAAKLVPLSEQS